MKRNTIIRITLLIVTMAVPAFAAGPDGAALYKAKCATCHAADGSGQTTMGKNLKLRDLRSTEVQKQTDKELFTWTADGKGKMPAYKGKLTDAEINALVAYMRELAKKK
ncbi:MAG: cytochrome C [Acidobacteria bacterium]|nr:MAG: cytochrome C [Acidobacteriota bacterium]